MPLTRRPGNRVSRFTKPLFVARLSRALLPVVLAGILLVGGATVSSARAQIGSERYSSIVIEAASGNVLSAVNPDELRHPASLTKMMTLYMVFEALRDRRISLGQYVPVSPHAASMSPTKLGLMPGTRITVEQAILGVVTKSANDAASALGELLGGDEERFGQMMTLRARGLGMTHTLFRNASGLPDPEQVTTARDMATLGRRLATDFPTEYRYFSTPSFTWHGRTISNHDNLLRSYPGADGIKTGYIDSSGHNLVSSAMRGGVRLVGVVFGASSNPQRDIHMAALLDQGFERIDIPGVPRPAGRAAPVLSAANAAPLAAPATPVARRAAPRWSVQLGAYAREVEARQAIQQARRAADDGEGRVESVTVRGRTSWRAVVIGLTPGEARQACQALARHRIPCTPIRPENGELASR